MIRSITALLTLILLLLVVNGSVGAADASMIAIPHEAQIAPKFEAIDSTPSRTRIHWSVNELQLVPAEDGEVRYQMPNPRAIDTEDAFPVHGGLVALPWGYEGNLSITGGSFFRLTQDGSLVEDGTMRTADVMEEDFVQLGSAGVFRDLVVAPVTVHPVQEGVDGSIWVAAELTFEVTTGRAMAHVPDQPQRPLSRAYLPLYESLLLNDIDDLGVEVAMTKGTYLIVAADVYQGALVTSGFLDWKRQKGYNVVLEMFPSADGINLTELTDMVHNYYQTLDPPLEYVLLVGDENRGDSNDIFASIPAERIPHPDSDQFPDENDVTDWPLAFIDGDDYFPELMVGRWTVGDWEEATGAAKRTVLYEKNKLQNGSENIALDDPYWTSAALVAANYSESSFPVTPIAVSEWLRDNMLSNWGFNLVSGLYWRLGGDNTTAGEIRSAIDAGVTWVTYRGWGNSSGWVQPTFGVQDVQNLENFNTLPVLTSFVCNTGDFGHDGNGGRCFGEYWFTAGNGPNEPTGAVAVIAPSDLHTNTRYNNSLISGFFWGVYEENLTGISTALLRAKTELYLGYPTQRNFGNFVPFYYHVYHVLGDPELDFWKGTPREFDITMPAEIAYGQGHVDVTVNGPNGPAYWAYVQLIQGDNLFAGSYTNESGIASIPIPEALEGEIEVTVTAPNYIPVETSISVAQQPDMVGVLDWDLDAGVDGQVNRGETVDLTVTLRNGGTQSAPNVSATLMFPDQDLVTIDNADATFGTVAAGGEADNGGNPFSFTLNDYVWDQNLLEFELEISSGDNTWMGKLWAQTGREVLSYVKYENVGGNDFAPGETATLRFKFTNEGSVDAPALDMTLSSFDEAVTEITGSVDDLAIPVGDDVWIGPFDITIDEDAWRGRAIPLRMSFKDDGDSYGTVTFNATLEGASSTDPFGPDEYGYYAYDHTDTAWPDNVPTYTWFNLDEDPTVTEHFQLSDDANTVIDLPFEVRFYGEDYPAGSPLTISSNGWVSFANEEEYATKWFRNWHIPSAIGPKAMIAPFWDDIGPQLGEDFMNVYYKHDEDNNRIIIEWSDAISRWSPQTAYPAYVTLVIYQPNAMPTETGDSVIEMFYQEVINIDDRNNFATIGIEKPDKTTGLEYTYAGLYPETNAEIDDGLAIRFTTNAPTSLNEIGDGEQESSLPGEFTLYPVQPNPFNSSTVISFDLPESGDVQLSIYNLLGQEIARLVDRPMTAGHKEVVWQINDRSISSGMLLIRLGANGQEQWGKMMYVK